MVFGLAFDGELDNERSSLSAMQPESVGTKEVSYLHTTLVVGQALRDVRRLKGMFEGNAMRKASMSPKA